MADFTIEFIKELNILIDQSAEFIRTSLPSIYSKELLDLVFHDFYTKNKTVRNCLKVTRPTATGYLNKLVDIGVLKKRRNQEMKIYI